MAQYHVGSHALAGLSFVWIGLGTAYFKALMGAYDDHLDGPWDWTTSL